MSVHLRPGCERDELAAPGLSSVMTFGSDADLAVGCQDCGVHGDERVGLAAASTLRLADPLQRSSGVAGHRVGEGDCPGGGALPARVSEPAAECERWLQVSTHIVGAGAPGEADLGEDGVRPWLERDPANVGDETQAVPDPRVGGVGVTGEEMRPGSETECPRLAFRFAFMRARSRASWYFSIAAACRPQSVRLNASTEWTPANRPVSVSAIRRARSRCSAAAGRRPASAST